MKVAELPFIVPERRALARRAGKHAANEDRVRSGMVFGLHGAVEVSDRSVEHGGAGHVGRPCNVVELMFLDAAGEALGEVTL